MEWGYELLVSSKFKGKMTSVVNAYCPVDKVDEIVAAGEGDTGAQFQERCAMFAMKLFWDEE